MSRVKSSNLAKILPWGLLGILDGLVMIELNVFHFRCSWGQGMRNCNLANRSVEGYRGIHHPNYQF
jgi:hypothetical protein